MQNQEAEQKSRAMLVSLGGSLEPVLYTLGQQQPEYILFFVSAESAGQIQGIIRELSYSCRDFDRILSPSAEILGDCYRALRDHLPGKLAQWGLSPEELLVDYTGGTKSMSAALVLATIEQAHRYSYVGGVERDKGGVGVVLGGRERMHYIQNPWKEVAQEERKRISLLFATARYETARQEIQRMLTHVEEGEREFWQAMAVLVEGYCDWDNFSPRSAKNKLGRAFNFLKPYAGGTRGRQPPLAQLVLDVETLLEFLNRLTSSEGRDEAYILDLIANADRRADIEGKYEDAVARLYSCLERGAKFRLQRQYRVSTDDVKVDQLPEAIRSEFEQKYRDPREGKIRLPLFAAYRLLDALGDALGQRFIARQEEILKLLSLRNLSPLGHGENPVGQEGYGRFRALLVELLGIDEAALPKFATLPL
jgi:CRISPR-associated protein (TIGR02710 family)